MGAAGDPVAGNLVARGWACDAREVPPTLPSDLRRSSLSALLEVLGRAGAEGELQLHRAGRTHRVLLREGRVVAARVAGRFDPLLRRLRREGGLDEDGYRRALESLARSERRSGELARAAGAEPARVRRGLERQLRDALLALGRLVDGTEATPRFVGRRVEPREVVAVMPRPPRPRRRAHRSPGSPARRPLPARPAPPGDRRALRALALALHPDRHPDLSPEERPRREAALARATAAFHGL